LRTFFWVPEGSINRNRPDAKRVVGIQALHLVWCLEAGKVQTRHLSCCCQPCKSGVGACLNPTVAGEWTTSSLIQQVRHPRRQHVQLQPPQPDIPLLLPPQVLFLYYYFSKFVSVLLE
jgi:hypothetical protein